MTDIYKLIHLDQSNVKNMIVFWGNSDSNSTELFNSDNNNPLFEGLFSKEELNMINTENIKVNFSQQVLYLDDTIETIKKKIIIETNNSIGFDEIYLFCKQIVNLNN